MIEKKWLLTPLVQLIIGTTLARVVLACLLNLGNDEVYYFTYAVQPDWNHFDHPPLIGLFIRLTTINLHWVNAFTMRLPAIMGPAINTWLIVRCGQLIRNERAGLFAAVLYNTSIYTSIISGLFILPDSVQLVFWLAALHTMLKMVELPGNVEKSKLVLILGLWIGLAMMSKIHSIFLWFGFFAFIAFHQRKWLKNPYLYLSALISIAIASPILYWNFSNDFITWRFHSERVKADQGINFKSFAVTSIGQIVYVNPIQFVIYIVTLIAIARRENFVESSFRKLLLWCSIPIIIATMLVSLFRYTLPHWSGPGFNALIILAGAFLDERLTLRGKKALSLLRAAEFLMIFVCLTGPILIRLYPRTLSEKPYPKTGNGDFTLDLTGWEELLPAFEKIRADDIGAGRMSTDSPMVTNKWFPGGHLYYYVAYPLKMRFIGLGNLNDLHKFHWLNNLYGNIRTGSDVYYITPSSNFEDPDEMYGNAFRDIEKASTVMQFRNGKVARHWYVYRLKNAI